MKVEDILAERKTTHGSFPLVAATAQELKAILCSPRKMDDIQREALEMIATKLARIVRGTASEPEHWLDIAGYAKLVVEHLDQQVVQTAEAWEAGGKPAKLEPTEREVISGFSSRSRAFQAPGTECPECGAPEGEWHRDGCSHLRPAKFR